MSEEIEQIGTVEETPQEIAEVSSETPTNTKLAVDTSFGNRMKFSVKNGHGDVEDSSNSEVEENLHVEEESADEDLADKELLEDTESTEDSVVDSVEELGDINTEIDEDLADPDAPDQEIVLTPFERKKNRFKKGTLKWIREEHGIVAENVEFLEKEFAKLKNVLKVGVATYKSAKETSEERTNELDQFLTAQESLNEWMTERKGTYAWQLLSALSLEREKLAEFEKEIQKWVEVQTQDLYEEARDNKKRFLRKFRFSFGGFMFSLLLGVIVNKILSALGLGWIPMVLNFLGITNPIGIISQVIGFGAVFSWFFAFVFYFRDYSKWRRRLNKEIAEARFFLRAVAELSVEKGRLRFLHAEMRDFLALMAKLLHKPWSISDEWINYEGTNLDPTRLPKSMDVAVPREVGAFNDVKNRAMEYFIAQNWRDTQVSLLFDEYEKRNAMRSKSIVERIDHDSRLRKKLASEISTEDILRSVGDKIIQNLTEYVQREVLPNETSFNVDSIKPDDLAGLKMKSSLFDSAADLTSWQDFVAEILGPVGSWQQINFSSSGQLENLFDRKKVISYALVPERLSNGFIDEIKPQVVEKDDKSGIEVIVRVDVSTWIDGDKIS